MVDNNNHDGDESTDLDGFEDFEQEHPKWKYGDRKRAVLTDRDRELIWGDLDLDGQQLRDARYRIRQRVINGIYDIEGVAFRLGTEELEKVIEGLEERDHVNEDIDSHEVTSAIKGLLTLATQIQWIHSIHQDSEFIQDLEENLAVAFQTYYGPGELSISYEHFTPDKGPEDMLQRIVNGNATVEDFNFYRANWGYMEILKRMEEKEIESFVASREDKPDYIITIDYLQEVSDN